MERFRDWTVRHWVALAVGLLTVVAMFANLARDTVDGVTTFSVTANLIDIAIGIAIGVPINVYIVLGIASLFDRIRRNKQ